MTNIVTTDWLHEHQDDGLIILDASPAKTAEGSVSEYAGTYIPGARKFDLKQHFSDTSSPFPNTAPSAGHFEQECRRLGITNDSNIVIYDNLGVYASPRAWWLFRLMGHTKVAVLDGGLPAWINTGLPVVDDLNSSPTAGDFNAHPNMHLLVTYEDVVNNLTTQDYTLVDARSSGRFDGTAPDPRQHLQSGHIPYSVNLPYKAVLDGQHVKSADELKRIFTDKGLAGKELVYSCGSGLTACIIMLAGTLAGQESLRIYDGSWTEWAELQGLTSNSI